MLSLNYQRDFIRDDKNVKNFQWLFRWHGFFSFRIIFDLIKCRTCQAMANKCSLLDANLQRLFYFRESGERYLENYCWSGARKCWATWRPSESWSPAGDPWTESAPWRCPRTTCTLCLGRRTRRRRPSSHRNPPPRRILRAERQICEFSASLRLIHLHRRPLPNFIESSILKNCISHDVSLSKFRYYNH